MLSFLIVIIYSVILKDWLNVETLLSNDLAEDLSLGERWLTEMGNAAEFNNITIQYCMSLPRHGLMSTQIPVVTQVRGNKSCKKQRQQKNNNIGLESRILVHILMILKKV